MNSYISPVCDIFVKFLFGTEENKGLLISFINAVLEDSEFPGIVEVELKNPFNYKTCVLEKVSILDVRATDEKGRIYDIEVQAGDFNHFEKRSLYYWAKLYSSQLNESEHYKILEPVICINLIDGVIFKELDRLHTCFLITERNDSEYVLTDHLMMHFLEIGKLKDIKVKQHLKKWVDYFTKEGKEDMTILLKDDPVMEKAHKAYEKFTRDDQLRQMYEAREKWRKDQASLIDDAEQRGEKRGEQRGEQRGDHNARLNTARKLLEMGYPIEDVSTATGLSPEEIDKLR